MEVLVVCGQGAPAPGNERFGASPVGLANEDKGRKGMYPSYGAINQLQAVAGVHKITLFTSALSRRTQAYCVKRPAQSTEPACALATFDDQQADCLLT
jgi:hypothetical protein